MMGKLAPIRLVPLLVLANLAVLITTAGVGWWTTHEYDELFFATRNEQAQRLADAAVADDLWQAYVVTLGAVAQQVARGGPLAIAVAAKDSPTLGDLLPDAVRRGAFAGGDIKLVGVSVHDAEMNLLAESWPGNPEPLPPEAAASIGRRPGADRGKPTHIAWLHEGSLRLTVLVPIGDPAVSGYLGLHVDPLPALKDLDRLLGMEVEILAEDGRLLYAPHNVRLPGDARIGETSLVLRGPAGERLGELRVRTDDAKLTAALDRTRRHAFLVFLMLAGTVSGCAIGGVAYGLRRMGRREGAVAEMGSAGAAR